MSPFAALMVSPGNPGCHPERSEGSLCCPRLPLVLHPPECHPERSEGSSSMGAEKLRGVYPECNESAQQDNWGNPASPLLMASFTGTFGFTSRKKVANT